MGRREYRQALLITSKVCFFMSFSIFVLVKWGLNASSEETFTKVCEFFNIRGFHLGIRYFPNVMNG